MTPPRTPAEAFRRAIQIARWAQGIKVPQWAIEEGVEDFTEIMRAEIIDALEREAVLAEGREHYLRIACSGVMTTPAWEELSGLPPDETPPRAPVRGDMTHAPGTIAWEEHERVWAAYAARRFDTEQSAARIAERGGFGYEEITEFLGREPETYQPAGEQRKMI